MLGVSRRSLHRAFHDTLGVGPVAYLRLRRLSSVRRALRRPLHTSVTQAALDHGFTDLGRFAGYYHEIFGEKPSQTRRRAMADFAIPMS
jgi:AraC family ethanolamine operon transcriptional activator